MMLLKNHYRAKHSRPQCNLKKYITSNLEDQKYTNIKETKILKNGDIMMFVEMQIIGKFKTVQRSKKAKTIHIIIIYELSKFI